MASDVRSIDADAHVNEKPLAWTDLEAKRPGWFQRGDMIPAMRRDPAEYIAAGQCCFSFECTDPFVSRYIAHFGAESLVFSSDYPHWDCDCPGTVTEARNHNSGLGDDELAKILGGDAPRLCNLA